KRQGAVVVDAAAVASKDGVSIDGGGQGSQGAKSFVVDTAAEQRARAAGGRVDADETIAHRQRAGVIDGAAALRGRIAGEDAVTKREGRVVVDSAPNIRDATPHRQAGKTDNSRADMKNSEAGSASGRAALDGQLVGARSSNHEALVDQQFGGGQGYDAVDREINRVAGHGIGNDLAQGTRPAVGGGAYRGGLGGGGEQHCRQKGDGN